MALRLACLLRLRSLSAVDEPVVADALDEARIILAEQRDSAETGIKAVQSFAGEAVWRAFDEKTFDVELFDAAWQRQSQPQNKGRPLREAVPAPKLFY